MVALATNRARRLVQACSHELPDLAGVIPLARAAHHAQVPSPRSHRLTVLDCHQPGDLVQVIRSCAALAASSSASVTALDLVQTPGGHRVQSVSSLNPRPLKIIGTHLSARAARVFTCLALET